MSMVPGVLDTEGSPVLHTVSRSFVVVGPDSAGHAVGQHTSSLREGLVFDA